MIRARQPATAFGEQITHPFKRGAHTPHTPPPSPEPLPPEAAPAPDVPVADVHAAEGPGELPTARAATPILDGDPASEVPAELVDHPRYRILHAVGVGGMGSVFKAEHRMMGRLVALKVIKQEYVTDESAVTRFMQEVRAAGQLAHPNIVTAYDAERAGDCHFLVTEFVDGVNLARLVESDGPLSVACACDYLHQAARGLEHAHARGMVHRDIKPQNLMVTRDGTVKILDFGLARLVRERTAPAGPAGSGLTMAGEVLGTPDYLAPEQARSARDVDGRADLYALGCTAFVLLTAQVPFPAPTALEKLFLHCDAEPPRVEGLRPEVPAALGEIVRKLMAKRREDRYQTAGEAAEALAAFLRPSRLVRVASAPPDEPELTAATAPTRKVAVVPTPLPAVVDQAPAPAAAPDSPPAAPPAPRPRRSRALLLVPVVGVLLGLGFAVFGRGALARRADAGRPADAAPASLVEDKRSKPRVLFVLASQGFSPREYGTLCEALEKANVEVAVACWSPSPAVPEGGGTPVEVQPRFLLPNLHTADFDALVIVGGAGVVREYTEGGGTKSLRNLLGPTMLAGKPVVALGTGVAVLAEAGVLANRPVACVEAVRSRIAAAGGQVVQTPYVEIDAATGHGPLITARDSTSAPAVATRLLRALGNPGEPAAEPPPGN
jgi:eukaryotic-like serine/threonine-protein kinase